MVDDLIRCPQCEGDSLVLAAPDAGEARCRSCSAAFPVRDGVIDVLPGVAAKRSPTQVIMESAAVVRIYESRLWRRSVVTRLVLGLSFEDEQALIQQAANLRSGDTVLDLACGPGIYTRPFAWQVRPGTVVGLDLSLPMLRYASRRVRAEGLRNIVLIHGTALQLPFPPRRFDVVNCCGALHLFPDVPRVLAEVHRVLKPGGRFTVAAVRRQRGRCATLGNAYRRCMGVDSFSADELASRLVEAGFGRMQTHYDQALWLIMSARKPE